LHPGTIFVSAANALKGLSWAIGLLLIFRLSGRPGSSFEVIVAAAGFIQVAGAIIRYLTLSFRVEPPSGTSPETLLVEQGLLFRNRRAIPVARIQNIIVTRDLVHRLFRLSALKIQTAAGQQDEVDLSALSVADAEALRSELLLRQRAATPASATPSTAEEKPASQTLYTASLKDLVLAGATQTRVGAVIGGIIGIGYFAWDLFGAGKESRIISAGMSAIAEVLPDSHGIVHTVLVGAATLALAVLAGWAVSIATSVFRHYKFRIELNDSGKLTRKFGLTTLSENAFPLHRLQKLSISAPLVQRLLGYSNLRASTAGSFKEDDSGGSTLLCPIIHDSARPSLLAIVLPDLDLTSLPWHPVSPLAVSRWTLRNSILLLVPITGAAIAYSPYALAAVLPAILLAYLLARLQYARTRYAVTPTYFATRKGLLTITTNIVPRKRVQGAVLVQSPGQRYRDLATLRLATAADPLSADIVIPHLPRGLGIELQDSLVEFRDSLVASRAGK
jgi:putative membrane protein